MFGKLASVMYERRWWVIGVWVAVLLASVAGAVNVGSVLGPGDFTLKGADSAKAAALMDTKFHQNDMRVTLVVIHSPKLTIRDASFRQTADRIASVIRGDKALKVTYLDNPLVSGNNQLMSRDRHSIALLVSSNLKEEKIEGQIDHLRSLIRTPGFATYVTGTAAQNHDSAVQSKQDLAMGENVSVPILLVILLLVFGTLVAAGIPLLLTGVSVALSLALVFLFGHWVDTSVYVTNVVTTLGIGIGIDYSLFITYRFREELEAFGGDTRRAIIRTMETTGRSVFFAGLTVATGLSALILTGVSFMQSMGLGGVLVPGSSLLVAMTLLPAVLSVLGTRVNRFRVVPTRFLQTGEGRAWRRLAEAIMRRPLVAGGLVLVIMLALAYPASRLQFANGSLKNEPGSMESVAGIRLMQADFPSAPNPVQIVVSGTPGSVTSAPQIAAMVALEAEIQRDPEVAHVQGLSDVMATGAAARNIRGLSEYLSADHTTAVINVTAKDDPGTQPVSALVQRIRDMGAGAIGLSADCINVGGEAAQFYDFDNALYSKFPAIVAFVMLLSYGFLFYAFRSAFLPLKAVVLNLLSVAAAYGLLQFVFQQGVGAGLLNFSPESGVAGWVPIFLFAFLFGLSMDYEVFLLSRIRERWLVTGNNREAVTFGLEKTGRLISSAASIMVIAFGAFLIGHQVELKELGFGLMASIALDATLIRVVLVPSIMAIIGGWNWWVPSFLRGAASRGTAFGEGDLVPVPVVDEAYR